MKKNLLLFVLLVTCSFTFAQKRDLFVGATGGYITVYKNGLAGLNVSYHLSNPLEVSFTGLMNPSMRIEEDITLEKSKLKMYSANLDFRYYMLLQRNWAMGPFIGGQYIYLNKKYIDSPTNEEYTSKPLGFNLGWHLRFNVTDNVKINGGWRYTSSSKDASHHFAYLGIGYTFNLE